MKKIIGLIIITGISYGASVVTPPGIQVVGGATNNNVMVYSDGALIDSGVAPTNLVSVTNLTADIEELQANSIDSDVWAGVSNTAYSALYLEGTTNKTLIDAAIAGAVNGVAEIINSNGTRTVYSDLVEAFTNLTDNATLNVLASTTATDQLPVYADNVSINGNGHIITVSQTNAFNSGLVSGQGVLLIKGNNINITDLNIDHTCEASFPITLHGYTAYVNLATNVCFDSCNFQLTMARSNETAHTPKTFVVIGAAVDIAVKNTTISALSVAGYTDHYALSTHGIVGTPVYFENCNIIWNGPTVVGGGTNQVFYDCRASIPVKGDANYTQYFDLIPAELERSYLLPGAVSYTSKARPIGFSRTMRLGDMVNRQDFTMYAGAWDTTTIKAGSGAVPYGVQTGLTLSSGTTSNSYIKAHAIDGPGFYAAPYYSSGVATDQIEWSKPFYLSTTFMIRSSGSECKHRIQWGGVWAYEAQLATRGIALVVRNLTVYLQTHNGSAIKESSAVCTLTANVIYKAMIYSDGKGTVSMVFYAGSSTYYATITGGPTSVFGNQHRISCVVENNDSAVDASMTVGALAVQMFE